MTSAPVPNRAIYVKGTVYGVGRAYAAIVIDQAKARYNDNHSTEYVQTNSLHGYNSSKVPIGLSIRVKYR